MNNPTPAPLPKFELLDIRNGFQLELTLKRYFVTYANAKARETAIAERLKIIRKELHNGQNCKTYSDLNNLIMELEVKNEAQ